MNEFCKRTRKQNENENGPKASRIVEKHQIPLDPGLRSHVVLNPPKLTPKTIEKN